MTAAAPAVADADQPCPNCGYDLRGLGAGQCPECGTTFDPADFTGEARIPWQHRQTIGRWRGFWRTVWLTLRNPSRLAAESAREVDYSSARRFQWTCSLLATLAGAPLLVLAGLDFRSILLGGGRPPVADLALLAAMVVGLFFWLLLGTGLPTYFFHPRSKPVRLQNNAIALAYYAAGPLALWPMAVMLFAGGATLADAAGKDGSSPHMIGVVLALAGIAAFMMSAVLLITLPVRLLTRSLHAGVGRILALIATLLIAWPTLLLVAALGPITVFWVFYLVALAH